MANLELTVRWQIRWGLEFLGSGLIDHNYKLQKGDMLRKATKITTALFSAAKEEYSRHFIVKLHFSADGYYESNQYRPQFISMLTSLQKQNKAIVLGGDSFPFSTSTFFINCDQPQTATQFATKNIFVQKGIASSSIEQVQRISSNKMGNVANFYQMKLDM